MINKWFLFFFRKSIYQRLNRIIIASISVTLAVTIITGMAGITYGIREKIGSELKAYGANMIVVPKESGYIREESLETISNISGVNDVEGQVIGTVFLKNQQIEIMGLDIERVKDKGWRIYGEASSKKGYILAGINLKNALKLEEGSNIELSGNNITRNFIISGFFERGGPEDSFFLMTIEDAREILSIQEGYHIILIKAKTERLEIITQEIERMVSNVIVKTIRQVAFAEESLLRKIQLLMVLVTIVIIFATGISVGSTMGANVLERRNEIGLMKALGATKKGISLFYLGEAFLTGLAGGFWGFILSIIFLQMVSKGAFGSYASIPIYMPLLSLLAGILISILSSYFPVRNAMKYNPSVILREE